MLSAWNNYFSHSHYIQVLQVESLMSKIRTSGLDIMLQLKSSLQYLPGELSSVSLEVLHDRKSDLKFLCREHSPPVF